MCNFERNLLKLLMVVRNAVSACLDAVNAKNGLSKAFVGIRLDLIGLFYNHSD